MSSLVFGFIAAFLLAALPGRIVIDRLRKLGAKQNVSTDAPTAHAKKQGTPTMGGVLILASLTLVIGIASLMPAVRANAGGSFGGSVSALFALLLLTLAFGAIGFTDDYLSLRRGRNLGLRAREKLAAQFVAALLFVVWMVAHAQTGLTTFLDLMPAALTAPHAIDLGFWYYPLAALLIVGFSNATNITDGLDGLSSGLTILISFALAALVYVLYPTLGLFAAALAGALAGFLWWNAHPAKVFMGDTASLALGAGLAGLGLLGKQEIGLIVASLVCWSELISVMIQVSVFKLRKRKYGIEYARANRVFRRTPLHHHFEECGMPETQVVARFWIAGALCAALALLWGRL